MNNFFKLLISLCLILIPISTIIGEESEEIESINKEREDVLRYGIDSEVISLLKTLKSDEDPALAEIVSEIYARTLNPDVMNEAVNYFITIEYEDAFDAAEKRIINWEDEDYDVLYPSLQYLSHFHNEKTEDLILPLIDNQNKQLASTALSTLGKCGTEKSAEILLDMLDDESYHEELKPTILKTLGDIKSEIAIDTLIDILDDIDEEKSWRWSACEALGKIAHPDALPSIKTALKYKDTYLRAHAVRALTNFDDESVEDILIESLRDSFWRVRVSAAEALGERKSNDAVDILIYKAKKDPEKNVKLAALKALGKINEPSSLDVIRDLYKKHTTPQSVRNQAAEIIINNDISNSIECITEVLSEEWERDKSPVLSYTCKFLSKTKEPNLEPLFERMLGHKDVAIKIYGIRGIQLNGFSSLKEKLEKLTEEGNNKSVRKEALSAVEKL